MLRLLLASLLVGQHKAVAVPKIRDSVISRMKIQLSLDQLRANPDRGNDIRTHLDVGRKPDYASIDSTGRGDLR